MAPPHFLARQLADGYSLPELRAMLDDFGREYYAARALDDPDAGWWLEHGRLIKEAMALRRARDAYYTPSAPGMPRYLDPEEVKERVDLVALIGQHIKLQKAGHAHKALCPFHNEREPSFYVFPEHNRYRCFGCGAHGDCFTFVQQQLGMDFRASLEYLAAMVNLPVVKHTGKRHLVSL